MENYPCHISVKVRSLIESGYFNCYTRDVRIIKYKKLNKEKEPFSYNPIVDDKNSRLLDIVEIKRIHHGNPKLKGQSGLFARKKIPKDSTLGCYLGGIYEISQYKQNQNDLWQIGVQSKDFIIAPESKEMVLRFINDSRISSEEKRLNYINVNYIRASIDKVPVVILYTNRNVHAGAQLFLEYGDTYWNNQ